MENAKIAIDVSAAGAFARGETGAGKMEVPVTGALLALLSVDERKLLAKYVAPNMSKIPATSHVRRLFVKSRTDEAVAEAIKAEQAKIDKDRAEKTERAARIAALLTGPREERLAYDPDAIPGERWSILNHVRNVIGYCNAEDFSKVRAESDTLNRADEQEHDQRLLLEFEGEQVLFSGESWNVRSDLCEMLCRGGHAHPRYPLAYERAVAECKGRNAEIEATRAAEWHAFLGKALAPECLERFEAGVLPHKELSDEVRGFLFRGFDLERYARIKTSEIVHDDDCSAKSFSCAVTDHADLAELDLTSAQFAAVKAIQAAFGDLPEYEITWRRHDVRCDECDERVIRIGARVTRTVCGRSFSREYDVG